MFIKSSTPKSGPLSSGLVAIGFVVGTLAGTSASYSADTVISTPQTFAEVLTEDGTVTVTSTGSITVDPGTVAIDAAGFNSVITLFGPVSAIGDLPASPPLTTIFQNGDTFNTLIVHQGGDIFATIPGTIFGTINVIAVDQLTTAGANTVELENATINVTTNDEDGIGIRQENTIGDNMVQFGTNGSIIINSDENSAAIEQAQVPGSTGNSSIVLGAGSRIQMESLETTRAMQQFTFGTGDTTIAIGDDARIDMTGRFGQAQGITQVSIGGSASTTIGSGAVINITGGSTAWGMIQLSNANDFALGANSIVNVTSTTADASGFQQGSLSGDSTSTIGANSQINIRAAGNALGLLSNPDGTSSSLTLEQGTSVFVSGDTAQGIEIIADGFDLRNSGDRIIATSTNAIQESFGVRMTGDGNTFVNHGTVFADLAAGSHAILMNGNNSMLSLLTYPVIQGQITFGDGGGTFGTGNTLTIGNGFDAVFTVGAGAGPNDLTVLGQGQPLFVNQIGPNLFQVISMGGGEALRVSRTSSIRMSEDLVRFLQQHINTRNIQNRQFLYQDNGMLQDFWFDASGFGQHSTGGRTYAHALGAFTIGYDRAFEDNGLGGIYGGYSIGSVTTGNHDWDNQLQTAYAGIYYDRSFDRIVTGLNLLGGISWDDTKRSYLDNTVPGGIANTESNGTGFLISPEITAGYEIPYRDLLVLPTISGRYTFFHQASYNEGGTNGFTLSDLNRQQINIRLELTGVRFRPLNENGRGWNTSLRGGLDVYANWGDDIDASIGTNTIQYDLEEDDSGVRPFVGADVEFQVNERAKLDFGAEGAYDTVRAVFGSINAGFSVLF